MSFQLEGVVKEWLPEEIAAFSPKFWPTENLHLDSERVFYKAINGGQTLKISLFDMLNPFGCAHIPPLFPSLYIPSTALPPPHPFRAGIEMLDLDWNLSA